MNLSLNCQTCGRYNRPCSMKFATVAGADHAPVMVVSSMPYEGERYNSQVGQSEEHEFFRASLRTLGWTPEEIDQTFSFVPLIRCHSGRDASTLERRLCADWLKADIVKRQPKLVVLLDYTIWASLTKAMTKAKTVGRILPMPSLQYHQRVEKKPVTVNTPGLHVLTLQDPEKMREQPEKNPHPFEEWYHNLTKIRAYLNGEAPKDPFQGKTYELVRDPHRAVQMLDWYASQPEVAWDIETAPGHAALDPFNNDFRVTMISMCAMPGYAHAIALQHKEAPLWDHPDVQAALRRFAASQSFKIAHNGHQFDVIACLLKLGVWIEIGQDSLVADSLLNENRPHTLKYLADMMSDLGHYEDELEEHFARQKIPRGKRDYEKHVPLDVLGRYACADADATLQVARFQRKALAELPAPGHGSQLDFYTGYVHRHSRSAAVTTLQGLSVDQVNADIARAVIETPYQTIRMELASAPETEAFRKMKFLNLSSAGKVLIDEGKAYWNFDTWRAGQPWVDLTTGTEYYAGGFEALRSAGVIHKKSFKTVKTNTFTPDDLEPNWIGGPDVGLLAQKILKLPVQRTEKGNVITRAEVLRELEHPMMDRVMKLKGLHKQRNTYVLPVTKGTYTYLTDSGDQKTSVGWIKDDGLIHPRILLAGSDRGGSEDDDKGGAVTGRISIKDPAAQTFAKRTEFGKRIYAMFGSRYADPAYPFAVNEAHAEKLWAAWQGVKPQSELDKIRHFVFPGMEGGGAIIQADYSQLELRLFAIVINCAWMLERYAAGADLHLEAAMEFFQITREEALANDGFMRAAAKSFWFGPIYGESAEGMTADLRKKGVPGNGPDGLITVAETQAILDRMMSRMPEFEEYKHRLFSYIDGTHCLYTGAGRRRYLPQWCSTSGWIRSKARRQAVNTTIQSLGADCTNWAWLTINEKLESLNWSLPDRLVLSVHDSLVGDTKSSFVPSFARFIHRTMSSVPWEVIRKAPIPLVVDVEAGPTWGELAKYEIDLSQKRAA